MQSVDRERSVTSDGCGVAVQYVWPDYVSKSDSSVAGMVNDHMGNLAGSGRWRLPLHDLIFGASKAGDSGTGRLPRQRAKKRKRVKRSGVTAGGDLPMFVDASSSLHKDLGLWAVDAVNPNGWSGMLKYLSQSSAEVVLGQESKVCSGDSKVAAERAAATSGWGAVLSPARDTDAGGISSGVMCAAKSFIGMACNTCSDIPDLFMFRICCAHVGAICKGGVHFVSLYFWNSEGLSKRNLDLMHYAAQVISSLQGPWIVSADFNMSPSVLRSSGWLNLVKGKLFEPEGPTCGLQKYDLFVVSMNLSSAILGAVVVSDAGLHPHSPVRLFI